MIQFREETRYPGYYYRTDFPEIDDDNWKVFVNSKYDRDTGEWSFRKAPYKQLTVKNIVCVWLLPTQWTNVV